MKKIRVLVVDDSAFMRKMISDMLSSNKHIEVVGTARNGEVCLEKIPKLQPDVITLDIEMPIMDGITTLEQIMKNHPTPVVMVSSVSDDQTMKAIHAITKGAVDFVAKPSGAISLDINVVREEIITKVMTASKAKIQKFDSTQINFPTYPRIFNEKKCVICIGASTGGPRALEIVLKSIPDHLQAPILIVQHMPASFTKSLAKRLNQRSKIKVKEARHNEVIKKSQVYVAPGDYHMEVKRKGTQLVISLTKDKPRRGHRPSVDVLLESLTSLKDYNKIAVILTGMGRDGAKGVVQLKKEDPSAIVITESEKSAIINGMPSSARATGYVNMTLHVDRIGETIVSLLNH